MATSLLSAIANVVADPTRELVERYRSRNRANNIGEALEEYIKDAFAETINESNEQRRLKQFEEAFSYNGNQNNPPDFIVRGGDAVEVKKVENDGASLALNSSYPKAKLLANSPMITQRCRMCEAWEEKNIIYAVGIVNGNRLRKLHFVYGIDYAASADVYERMSRIIRNGIEATPEIELADTEELGRVNRVDPLGITYLRIRGMWVIENPAKAFSYIYPGNFGDGFELTAVINTQTYDSFAASDRIMIERLAESRNDFTIDSVDIKTPDNPAMLKSARLITFRERA